MAAELALHGVVPEQGGHRWDDKNRFLEYRIPSPDSVFFGGPEIIDSLLDVEKG